MAISDPEEYTPYMEGPFVRPNDFIDMAVKSVHKRQIRSFRNSKCVHKSGPEIYKFTGEPFKVCKTTTRQSFQ